MMHTIKVNKNFFTTSAGTFNFLDPKKLPDLFPIPKHNPVLLELFNNIDEENDLLIFADQKGENKWLYGYKFTDSKCFVGYLMMNRNDKRLYFHVIKIVSKEMIHKTIIPEINARLDSETWDLYMMNRKSYYFGIPNDIKAIDILRGMKDSYVIDLPDALYESMPKSRSFLYECGYEF